MGFDVRKWVFDDLIALNIKAEFPLRPSHHESIWHERARVAMVAWARSVVELTRNGAVDLSTCWRNHPLVVLGEELLESLQLAHAVVHDGVNPRHVIEMRDAEDGKGFAGVVARLRLQLRERKARRNELKRERRRRPPPRTPKPCKKCNASQAERRIRERRQKSGGVGVVPGPTTPTMVAPAGQPVHRGVASGSAGGPSSCLRSGPLGKKKSVRFRLGGHAGGNEAAAPRQQVQHPVPPPIVSGKAYGSGSSPAEKEPPSARPAPPPKEDWTRPAPPPKAVWTRPAPPPMVSRNAYEALPVEEEDGHVSFPCHLDSISETRPEVKGDGKSVRKSKVVVSKADKTTAIEVKYGAEEALCDFRKSEITPGSITRRTKRTHLPQTKEEKASPLHVSSVEVIDIDAVRARMLPKVRDRFNKVYDWTFFPEGVVPSRTNKVSTFSSKHARQLAESGVAERTDKPGENLNIPFTVIETKETGMRQRPILWTRDANDALRAAGYTANVPIGHISDYLVAVNDEIATCRDLKTSFFQLEIPQEARHLFSFQDDEGHWWVLTRLPMGHVCAPELMHTVTSVIAGHPEYVMKGYAAKSRAHIWIDNVRLSGPRALVKSDTSRMDAAAKGVGATWKAAESLSLVKEYVFIGVHWNHEGHLVKPSDKIMSKMNSFSFDKATAGSIESFAGRLLHASAISGTMIGWYWYAVKFLRRTINSLNNGRLSLTDTVSIPQSAAGQLRRWLEHVGKARKIEPPRRDTFTVFVDASMEGWGGVLVDNATNRVTIVGGKFGACDHERHINELEALALERTVQALPHDPSRRSAVYVSIDNTSVLGTVRKGCSAANMTMNDAVVRALGTLKRKGYTWTMRYVRSAENPADVPSRVSLPASVQDEQKVVALVTNFFDSRPVVPA